MDAIDLNDVWIQPPVPKPPKILCVGLNYDDHLEESGLKSVYPEIFGYGVHVLDARGDAISLWLADATAAARLVRILPARRTKDFRPKLSQ